MSKIEVYSCVTGNYDDVRKTLFSSLPLIDCDVQFTLFTDKNLESEGTGWVVRPLAFEAGVCKRRIARWHKVNSHILFPQADITVWMDGSQLFKKINLYKDLIGPHMTGAHLATFKHPVRTCVYQEAQACKMLKKDNAKLIDQQMKKYRQMGYPAFAGMVETACVIRKNKPIVTAFNKLWWLEIDKHSFRDQLSFNYAASNVGLGYKTLAGERVTSPYFYFKKH